VKGDQVKELYMAIIKIKKNIWDDQALFFADI